MIEIEQGPSSKGRLYTRYRASREALLNAGIAMPYMFPAKANGKSSDRCKGYHPESGSWAVSRFEGELWSLHYYHDPFEPSPYPEVASDEVEYQRSCRIMRRGGGVYAHTDAAFVSYNYLQDWARAGGNGLLGERRRIVDYLRANVGSRILDVAAEVRGLSQIRCDISIHDLCEVTDAMCCAAHRMIEKGRTESDPLYCSTLTAGYPAKLAATAIAAISKHGADSEEAEDAIEKLQEFTGLETDEPAVLYRKAFHKGADIAATAAGLSRQENA